MKTLTSREVGSFPPQINLLSPQEREKEFSYLLHSFIFCEVRERAVVTSCAFFFLLLSHLVPDNRGPFKKKRKVSLGALEEEMPKG